MRSYPAPSSQNPKQNTRTELGIRKSLGPRCSFSGSHVGAKIVEYISQRELSTHM